MSQAKRLIPLPGAVDGKQWRVTDAGKRGATQTNLQRRTMAAPLDLSEESRQVQLHEMAHVAWSENDPATIARKTGIPVVYVEACEDARMTALLANLGLPQDAQLIGDYETDHEAVVESANMGRVEWSEVTRMEHEHPARKLAQAVRSNDAATALLVASYGTGDGDAVREAVREHNPNGDALSAFVDAIVTEHLTTGNPTEPEWTPTLARAIRAALAAAESGGEPEPGEGEPGEGSGGEGSGEITDGELDAMIAGRVPASAAPTPPPPGSPGLSGKKTPGTSGAPAPGAPAPGMLAPTKSPGMGAAQSFLKTRGAQRFNRNEVEAPGAAIGIGAPATSGTATKAPSVAPPPPPVHERRTLRESLGRVAPGEDGVAKYESFAVSSRRASSSYRGEVNSPVAFGADGKELIGIEGHWGPFNPDADTLHPRLTVRQGRAFLPKGKRRGTDAGSVPTGMHRLAIDGRVFRGPKLKDGNAGAVLIDVSGSMSLSLSQLKTILSVMPASIVACYSGEPNHLAILARRGLMVSDAALADTLGRMGGNNSIDGPALDWLAKQRGPRFWISDGGITGDCDSGVSVAMRAQVVQTCLRSRILRVGSTGEVVQRFGKAKRVAA